MKKVLFYGNGIYGTAKNVPAPLFNGWKKEGKIVVEFGEYIMRTSNEKIVSYSRVFGFGIQK